MAGSGPLQPIKVGGVGVVGGGQDRVEDGGVGGGLSQHPLGSAWEHTSLLKKNNNIRDLNG